MSSTYKGKIIPSLLAVPKWEMKWKTFNDLENFTVYSTILNNFFTNRYSGTGNGLNRDSIPFDGGFVSSCIKILNGKNVSENMATNRFYSLYSTPGTGFDLLKECDRTAFAVKNHRADVELKRGNFLMAKNFNRAANIKFLKGNTFSWTLITWSFDAHPNNILVDKLRRVIEGGFYDLWKKWIGYRDEGIT